MSTQPATTNAEGQPLATGDVAPQPATTGSDAADIDNDDDDVAPPLQHVIDQRPTSEQVTAWRQKYKRVYVLQFHGWMAIMRRPRIMDLERASMVADKKGAKKFDFNKNIIDNCTLYMDEGFKDDDFLYMALIMGVNEVAAIGQATVEKL